MSRFATTLSAVLLLALATPAQASWWRDLLGIGSTPASDTSTADSATAAAPGAPTTLGEDEITRGLREALLKGTDLAVAQLGRSDGFWNDAAVRIPLPDKVASAADVIRRIGGERLIESFHQRLNQAAEQAVPEAAAVFRTAVTSLTLNDVRDILGGADDAATRYFDSATRDELRSRFRPIVDENIASAGVTSAYTALLRQAGPYASMLGDAADLPAFVTDKALDGLFQRIAEEERKLRANPAERGSELLRRVFGAVGG